MSAPFWQDEVGTAIVASMPTPRAALEQIVRHESTPPAFYMTVWTANRALSVADSNQKPGRLLRLFSLVFSLGTTVLTFMLACELMPLWAAAIAGLIVSFGSELVFQGVDLRAYSLFAFAAVLFVFVLERAVAHPGRGRLAALASAVVLGSLTHYFFLLTLAAGAIWVLISVRERSTLRRVGVALAVGLVPLAVWSPLWFRQYRNGLYGTSPRFTATRPLEAVSALFAPQAVVNDIGRIGQAVVFTAVTASAIVLLTRRPEGRLSALLVLLPLTVTTAVAALGPRVLNTRNLIGIAPFAAIAVAWACTALPWRRVSQTAAVAVAVLLVASFAYGAVTLARTPYDHIAQDLVAQGFRHDEPLVWFGPLDGASPVLWYLTPDTSTARLPRFVTATPTGGSCPAVEIVARNKTGRRWLDQHRNAILARTTTPSYGDTPLGRRGSSDVVIARLGWSPGILGRAASANATLFRSLDAPAPCLR
jgi:hypothetical protein